jgi:hypothetical protein
VSQIPGVIGLARKIATAAPDARPLVRSMSWWWLVVGVVTFTTQNLRLWLEMDQSTEDTLFWGFLGTIWACCSLIATMRRKDIKVPEWIATIAEAIIADAPGAPGR